MNGRGMISIFIIVSLVLVGSVSAQANNLIANDTSSNHSMFPHGMDLFVSNLEAGSWTVIVSSSSFWGMQFRIEVSLSSDMSSPFVSVEGSGSGGVRANFVVEEFGAVYIRITEIGGNSGFYDVGVYDDVNSFFLTYGVFVIILVVVVIIVILVLWLKRNTGGVLKKFPVRVEAPEYAIPERYRSEPKTADIRTVRLPEKCSSCGAPLSADKIDWTGPLEAECNYCGAVIRARFEKL